MGLRNYLIEGVSGTGKTSVCKELRRRGYHAINGDRELAYQGDPETDEPLDGLGHEHHIWRVDDVRALVANHDEPVTFFCGGSRNLHKFVDLFDGVFVLEVDWDTLNRRLDGRPEDEWVEERPNANSSGDCTEPSQTPRKPAPRSTPPHPSRTSSTKSSAR